MRPRAARSLRIALRIAVFEQGSQPVTDDLALLRSVTASGCRLAPARTSIASSISPAERATNRACALGPLPEFEFDQRLSG
jgi:hypothetical protein